MTDQQLYLAIGVPVFAVFMGMLTNGITVMWQSKSLDRAFSERFKGIDQRFIGIDQRFAGIEQRLDKIDRTLEVIQADLKQFYKDIAQLKARTGME
jgi:septal ring factor EnvC (AmiA/AmiB activator)